MKFNREQYDEIVLTLENESAFYRAYMAASTYGARRQVIGSWLSFPSSFPHTSKTGLPRWSKDSDIEDRDQIRRYFDDRYERDQNQVNTYAHIPSVWDEPKAEPETIVEFEFPGTQAQADEQLAVYHHAAKQINQLCGIPTPTLEETTMNKPIAITTKTFVGETDIATLADSTIYTMIANEEAAIKELSAIENKPKRLVAEIEKRRTGILALVAHLDAKV